MHGLGNDFVVIDAREHPKALTPGVTRRIGDRRRGVGFDQLLVLGPPSDPSADVAMRILNPDGSEAGACGNGTRCVAAMVMAERNTTRLVVETRAGLLGCRAEADGRVTCDMGRARLDWADIPLARSVDTLHVPLAVEDLADPVAVSMGNPHIVFFTNHVDTVALERLGPTVEHHSLFPDRTNVEIAQPIGQDVLRMRVWERGVGITEACGTGACAVAVAAHRRGLTGRRVTVVLDGGTLSVDWHDSGHVWMTGPVATSFTGRLDASLTDPDEEDGGEAGP